MASDRRLSGYADLTFAQSAHMALARAADVAQTDIAAMHPEAFMVDDRRLQVTIDDHLGPAEVDALRRLLVALVHDAVAGEASLETDRGEKVSLRASDASDAHRLGAHASGTEDLDESETRPTIRTQAG